MEAKLILYKGATKNQPASSTSFHGSRKSLGKKMAAEEDTFMNDEDIGLDSEQVYEMRTRI